MKQQKPTLIFIHGFRGSSEGLTEVLAEFDPKKYNLYAPPIPPFDGAKPLKSYTPDAYADYLADYIKANKIKSPILVGHSMGSLIAAATAEKYPDLLADRLILLAPLTEKIRPSLARLIPLTAFFPNKLVGWLSTRYLFVPKNRAHYKKALKTTYRCGAACPNKQEVKRAAVFSSSHCLRDFSWPQTTLIISGEKDRVVPTKKIQSYAKSKNIEIKTVQNSGHLLNYEVPEQVATLIKNWLKNG